MDFTFEMDGREVTLSEYDVKFILKEYLEAEEKKRKEIKLKFGIAQTPTEGKAFEINQKTIDRSIFFKKRKSEKQEAVRQLIIEAFAEVDANPDRYARPFMTMVPKRTWTFSMTSYEFDTIAKEIGNHTANWVEQAMEWAQRISNGETWRNVCNKADAISRCRLVKWKDGFLRLIGGSSKLTKDISATNISQDKIYLHEYLRDCVPLIVL